MNKDIVVVAEHFKGKLNEVTFELLGKAREVAKGLGGKLVVLLLGQDLGGFIAELGGADVVWAADGDEFREFTPDVYASPIGPKLKEISPRLVLLGSTSVGLDLLSSCRRVVLTRALTVACAWKPRTAVLAPSVKSMAERFLPKWRCRKRPA